MFLAQSATTDIIGSGISSGVTAAGVMLLFIRYLMTVNEKKHDENKTAIKENTEAIHKLSDAMNKQTELGLLQLLANPNFPKEYAPRAEQIQREVK